MWVNHENKTMKKARFRSLTILIKIIKEAQLSNTLYRDINEYTHMHICIYIIRKYMCVCVHWLKEMKTQKSEWHQFSRELAGVLNNRGRNMCFVMYICYTYSLKYIKYFRIKEKGKEKKKKKGYQYIISLSWSEHHRPHFTTRNNTVQAAIMRDCLCFWYKSICRTGR